MRISIVLSALLISALTLTAMSATAAEEVYRWVDDNGVVHFGDRKPKNADSEAVDLPASHSAETEDPAAAPGVASTADPAQPSRAEQQREQRANDHKQAAEDKQLMQAECERKRFVVTRLEPSTRVLVTGKDGEVYRMDDQKRLEALDDAKSFVAENCSG